MWHYGDVVTILDGGSYSYGAGAAAQRHFAVYAFGRFLVYVFATVCGYIDVAWVKFAQLVDSAEQTVNPCPLKGREYLKGEGGAVAGRYGVDDAHRKCVCFVFIKQR